MRELTRLSLMLVGATLLVSCGTIQLPIAHEADVDRARLAFPEATKDSLDAGRQTFSLRCGTCHEPWQPKSRTVPEWEQAVAVMSPRAGLSGERQKLVLQYLTTFARR